MLSVPLRSIFLTEIHSRNDAGIKTSHPDLVKSAIDFFEQVWNDSETQTLEGFLKDKRII